MHCTPSRRRQQGFTLAEVLVASAIFTVIVVAALLMYDRSNMVFKTSSDSLDLQQNTRVAFNKLTADIRMAGFDYDRDGIPTGVTPTAWHMATAYNVGDIVVPSTGATTSQFFCTQGGTSGNTEPVWPSSGSVTDNTVTWQQTTGVSVYQQPDEQIEYAGQTAITIRANFDYDANEAEDRFNGREQTLEANTPQFPVITTGNDEIVTYALSKPSLIPASKSTAASGCSKTSTDCVHFFADVNNGGNEARTAYPGGNKERAVDIKGLDLTNSSPPYTLYRITLAKNGDAIYTPVAENIRSLHFKYYEDTSGATTLKDLATTPADVSDGIGGDGQYDPDNAGAVIADRLIRAKIKSVQVEIIGMNPNTDKYYNDPNPAWNATTDTVSPHTRKVTLNTLVVPRNLGKRGQRLQAVTPPGSPSITKVCVGYCGLAEVTWSAPSGGGVTGYNLLWDTASGGSFQNLQPQGLVTTGYIQLTPNQNYFFRVQALNDYGSNMSTTFQNMAFSLKNATTPADPSGLAATTTVKNEIDVTWQRPTTYNSSANTVTCTTATGTTTTTPPIPSQESISYNVWRSTTTPVDTSGPPLMAYTASGSSAPFTNVATGQVTFRDTNVVNCTNYYYAVQAVKQTCESNSAYNTQPSHSNIIQLTTPGQAASTGAAPIAPTGLQALATSSCTLGGVCTVNLQWNPVGKDTAGNTITIGTYDILRVQKVNGTVTTASSSPNSTAGSNAAYAGSVTRQVTNVSVNSSGFITVNDTVPQTDATTLKQYSYEYQVRAVQCTTPGAYSTVTIWPCTFAGGTTTVKISTAFQGNGTAASPYYFDAGGKLNITSALPVASIHAVMYTGATSGGVTTWSNPNDLGNNTGASITSAAFDIPSTLTTGTTYLFDVLVTDLAGCTQETPVQGVMEGTNCCLKQLADDPPQTSASATNGVIRGFTAGTSTYVDIFFENICSLDLAVQANGFNVTWDDSAITTNPKPKLNSIEFPTQATSGTNVAACSFDATQKCYTYNVGGSGGAGSYTVPTTTSGTTWAKSIPASTSTYRIRVSFSKAVQVQPISATSVIYLRTGDPSATTCNVIP